LKKLRNAPPKIRKRGTKEKKEKMCLGRNEKLMTHFR